MTRYTAITRIARIEERFEKRRKPGTVGIGEEAQMEEISTGWWLVTQAPEPYCICVGAERPPHAVGDEIRMTFEVRNR